MTRVLLDVVHVPRELHPMTGSISSLIPRGIVHHLLNFAFQDLSLLACHSHIAGCLLSLQRPYTEDFPKVSTIAHSFRILR